MWAAGLFSVDWEGYAPALFQGALTALELTATAFVGACLIGLVVALMRQSQFVLTRATAWAYTELIKNLPLLTGIFIAYFGLSAVNIRLSAFQAGCVTLSIFYGAYLAEIFRGSLLAVGIQQREAGQAVGLSNTQVMWSVVLPQAFRLALPGAGTCWSISSSSPHSSLRLLGLS